MEHRITKVDEHEIDAIVDQVIDVQMGHYRQTGHLPPPRSLYEAQRRAAIEQRWQSDLRHQQTSDAIGRLALGLGVATVGAVVLMALFVGVVKMLQPAPPPPVNQNCWLFCRAEVQR